MKKALTLCLLTIVILISTSSQAKILRVGYSGPAISGVDFTDVSSAVNAATAGDTIQLYQNASVGTSAVNKQLVFVGFGYSLESNPGLQAVPSTPNSVGLYFNGGSENSVVQGVYGTFYTSVNNITFSRCIGNVTLGYNRTIDQAVPISTVTIASSAVAIAGYYGAVSNALISNSIIFDINIPKVAGLVTNNIQTGGSATFGSCVVKNNIFAGTGFCVSGTSAIFNNNLFARPDNCGTPIAGSNNQFNVNMSNVFTNWNNGSYGSESNLALKAGSPAIGFGIDGSGNPTDAGIYGGDAGLVYKPSGIPAIPAIYQLTAPQLNASTNPYTISVSVRSNN
jgi:hypothetical protein